MWRSAAAAVVLAALVTGCGDDGAPKASPSPVVTTELPTSAPPTTAPPTSSTPTATSTCPSAPPLPAGATVVTATVAGGNVTTEHRQWQVKVGSKVRVAVTSDAADEVHVHTYDAKADTVPGCPTAIDFDARIPGTHEVELEKAHVHVLEIKAS